MRGRNKTHSSPPHPSKRSSPQDQLLYGCNVLNLGNSKVISVHAGTARQIVRDPKFRGDVQVRSFFFFFFSDLREGKETHLFLSLSLSFKPPS